MKKLYILIIALLFVLCGCSKSTKSNSHYTLLAPNGTPVLSTLNLDETKYEIQAVKGADPLKVAFLNKTHDIIIAPTNLGAIMYNNNQNYKLAASIVFGNYYLVTVGNELTLSSLDGKEIIAFGATETAGLILNYILDNNEFNTKPTIKYVDSVDTAQAELTLDNTKIILSAEPSLSILKTKISGIVSLDLQEEYKKLSGKDSYPQASLFVLSTMTKEQVEEIRKDIKNSINLLLTKVDESASKANEKYNYPVEAIKTSIPLSHITYKSAKDAKEDIDFYFELIMKENAKLLGGNKPSEEFLYQ